MEYHWLDDKEATLEYHWLDDKEMTPASHYYAKVVTRWLEVLTGYAGQSNLTLIPFKNGSGIIECLASSLEF